jgi:hypothetical protein
MHVDGNAQHVLNTCVDTTLDEYVEIIIEFIEFDAIEMAM